MKTFFMLDDINTKLFSIYPGVFPKPRPFNRNMTGFELYIRPPIQLYSVNYLADAVEEKSKKPDIQSRRTHKVPATVKKFTNYNESESVFEHGVSTEQMLSKYRECRIYTNRSRLNKVNRKQLLKALEMIKQKIKEEPEILKDVSETDTQFSITDVKKKLKNKDLDAIRIENKIFKNRKMFKLPLKVETGGDGQIDDGAVIDSIGDSVIFKGDSAQEAREGTPKEEGASKKRNKLTLDFLERRPKMNYLRRVAPKPAPKRPVTVEKKVPKKKEDPLKREASRPIPKSVKKFDNLQLKTKSLLTTKIKRLDEPSKMSIKVPRLKSNDEPSKMELDNDRSEWEDISTATNLCDKSIKSTKGMKSERKNFIESNTKLKKKERKEDTFLSLPQITPCLAAESFPFLGGSPGRKFSTYI